MNHADAAMRASGGRRNIAAVLSTKQLRLSVTSILLLLVWTYARFEDFRLAPRPPQTVVGTFTRAEPLIAMPGSDFKRINAREGPGTEYPVRQQFNRGTPLAGIARRSDQDGAYWIELEGGRGFVKESVLASGRQ